MKVELDNGRVRQSLDRWRLRLSRGQRKNTPRPRWIPCFHRQDQHRYRLLYRLIVNLNGRNGISSGGAISSRDVCRSSRQAMPTRIFQPDMTPCRRLRSTICSQNVLALANRSREVRRHDERGRGPENVMTLTTSEISSARAYRIIAPRKSAMMC